MSRTTHPQALPADADPHRLHGVTPRHYAIELAPDLEAGTFRGRLIVDLEVDETSSVLTCNAAELTIERATIIVGETQLVTTVQVDASTERIHLHVRGEIPSGPARLDIEFAGTLSDRLEGFYRSTYPTEQGQVTVAVTQMEATDARRVFPCWDQPDLKATFGLTLIVDPSDLAIANTSATGEERLADGRSRITFADTIPMSTYLVAAVVGRLDATDPTEVRGVPIRVVHRPGRREMTGFALDVAAHSIEFFEDYYGIAYPSDKVDLVGIPDFAAGAMENLGCITFREVLLLVDEQRSTQSDLQEVADVINHEMAHMWFGDLVTMRWWNGLWLNEAFATFMETAATDAYRPEWDRWTSFAAGRAPAFDVDALGSTRPIEYPVHTPSDADDMFDVLTYQKGASVLRMLEQYLGADVFQAGVRVYLQRHQFGNTETHDLWDALEEASGQPVRRIMESWIFQPGFPCIDITIDGDRVRLRQRRFRYDRQPDDSPWAVPVRLRCTDGSVHALLVEGEEWAEITVNAPVATGNVAGSGFYRVNVIGAPDTPPTGLTAVERYSWLDDAMALSLAGELPAPAVLDRVYALRHDDDPDVWRRITEVLTLVSHVVSDEVRPHLATFVHALTEPFLADYGSDPRPDDSERCREARGLVAALAGGYAPTPARLQQARHWLADPTTDAALRAAATHIVAVNGTAPDWDEMRERALTTEDPQDEERFQRALAEFPDPALVLATCELALSDEIRSQDAAFILRVCLRNRAGGAAAWSFIESHWDELLARIPTSAVPRLLDGIRWLSSPELAETVTAFLDTHPVHSGERQIRQHRERMGVYGAWRSQQASALAGHLTDLNPT